MQDKKLNMKKLSIDFKYSRTFQSMNSRSFKKFPGEKVNSRISQEHHHAYWSILDMPPWSVLTAVTPDTVKNYFKNLKLLCKSFIFSTKWFTKLCNSVHSFLRDCVTKSNLQYLKKVKQKKTTKKQALTLKKGLTV